MSWIIFTIVAVVIIYVISVYNNLKTVENRVENAWSQIDVQLQRRFDLIPNFVETVKGYMNHESETFEKIAALRTSWANTQSVSEKANIDNQLSGALKTIWLFQKTILILKLIKTFQIYLKNYVTQKIRFLFQDNFIMILLLNLTQNWNYSLAIL